MILFSNLEEVKTNDAIMNFIPVLKLTTNKIFEFENLNKSKIDLIEKLKKESKINNFKIIINDKFIENYR